MYLEINEFLNEYTDGEGDFVVVDTYDTIFGYLTVYVDVEEELMW